MIKMFEKKNNKGHVSLNIENYRPAHLPPNAEEGHIDLSTFIPGSYSLLEEKYLEGIFDNLEKYMSPVVQLSDEFTVGESGDEHIEFPMAFIRSKHEEEVVKNELSGVNILKARQVRKQELEERIPKDEKNIQSLEERVDTLKDKHARHALRFGSNMVQLGIPVTILAFMADFFVNTEFVQSILYSNVNMLMILVICLCLMSDGTMYALGTLVSQKSNYRSKALYCTFFTIFVTLFVISVLGSIAIRIGSMPLVYGSFDAAGNFIGKESFTLAEYALTIVSSLATAVTGALSFFFSVDPDFYLEKECIKLQKELKEKRAKHNQIVSEYAALMIAKDPMAHNKKCQEAAEKILEALPNGLKIRKRMLFAIHQQEASYADAMSVSAKQVLEGTVAHRTEDEEKADDGEIVTRDDLFTMSNIYKEAV